MDENSIVQYIANTFLGLDIVVGHEGIATGDTFFFYDPDRRLDPAHRFPFATIVTKDYGDFDRASNLDRPGVFRLNIGIGRETFRASFSEAEAGYDFTALDQLMPHPVYGKMHWVCVLNPSAATFEKIRPLLAEAYDRAAGKSTRR